jgi:hypothetical protein
MSALGQKQTLQSAGPMSALLPKADIRGRGSKVLKVDIDQAIEKTASCNKRTLSHLA